MTKIALLLLAIANSSMAFAANSNVYDLMYLPAKGTFAGETSVDFTSTKFTLDYQGRTVSDTTVKNTELSQTFLYSLSDKTGIGVKEEFLIDSKTENKYGPGSNSNGTVTKTKGASGFSEPTFLLKQRILDQETSGAILDFSLSFAPKLGDAKSSSTTKGGNNLRGGTEFSALVEVGKKNEETQWKFELSYTLYGNSKSKSASDATDLTQTDSYSLFGGGFTHQWKLAPTVELNLAAGVAFLGEINSSNAHDQTKDVADSTTMFTFGPSLNFNLSDKSMINVSAQYLISDDTAFRETDTSNNTVTTLMLNDRTALHLSVMARYEF